MGAPQNDAADPVVCIICGSFNEVKDTFRCKKCGREHLCREHRDKITYLCEECECERREAEALARRESAARASQTPTPVTTQPVPRKIPWWGWLGMLGGTLLGMLVLGFAIYIIVAAKRPLACAEVGKTWVSPVDGMTLVCVPKGKFPMGSDDGDDNEKPVHEVYLDAYWMDQTEVTNAQYGQCVAAGQCTAPHRTGSSNRDNYYGDAPFNHYPVIYVDWNQAAAYCAWAGRGLPTEAQWEKAARGTDGRTYPWGDTFDGTKLNFADKNTNFNYSDKNVDDGYADTAPVGNYPQGASLYGALDMAGNVWEWVADWYGPYPSGDQTNPVGPSEGEYRVLRGGGWNHDEDYLRSSNRLWYTPGSWDYLSVGFRCARSSD